MRVVAFQAGEQGEGDRVFGVDGEGRGWVEVFHCGLRFFLVYSYADNADGHNRRGIGDAGLGIHTPRYLSAHMELYSSAWAPFVSGAEVDVVSAIVEESADVGVLAG